MGSSSSVPSNNAGLMYPSLDGVNPPPPLSQQPTLPYSTLPTINALNISDTKPKLYSDLDNVPFTFLLPLKDSSINDSQSNDPSIQKVYTALRAVDDFMQQSYDFKLENEIITKH